MTRSVLGWGLACAASGLLGIAVGSFSTRTLYGEPSSDAVRPARARPVECPDCPPCPVCPPPPECATGHPVPADGAPTGGAEAPDEPALQAEPLGPPGLALSTIRAAEAAVLEELRACHGTGRGSAVLELTVTVTGSTGAITEAFASRSRLEGAEAEACLTSAATRTRFTADGSEGQSVLKLPVELGGEAGFDEAPPPD